MESLLFLQEVHTKDLHLGLVALLKLVKRRHVLQNFLHLVRLYPIEFDNSDNISLAHGVRRLIVLKIVVGGGIERPH